MAGRPYIPRRIVLLERFGAAYYAYLFLNAQGRQRDASRRRTVRAGREYLRAGGTSVGLRRTAVHVQEQTQRLIEDWYGAQAVRGFGPDGALVRRLISEIER